MSQVKGAVKGAASKVADAVGLGKKGKKQKTGCEGDVDCDGISDAEDDDIDG
jgi:hypothetical protein